MSISEAILHASRRIVELPVLGQQIEVRSLRVREMLDAGLLPLIKFRQDEVDPDESVAQADSVLRMAREILCVASVNPKIARESNPSKGVVSIDDIPEEDVLTAFNIIVELSDSRFYGTDHTAFDPMEDEALLDGQLRVATIIDSIARRYSISPLEIERWSNEEFARVMAYIEAGNNAMEKARADA